jgi:thioredoxin-like negative regulator of GroEL
MSARAEARQAPVSRAPKPILLFFYAGKSGSCRRVEGFLAQVLQRRHNHDTFTLHRIDADLRPDLAERFRIAELPTLLVVEDKRTRVRLEQPRGCVEIQTALAPWLR